MRRIKQAKIKYISLVPRGANRLPVIFKEDTGALDVDMLVKAADDFEAEGTLLAVVYAPEIRDSQGDIASAPVIKQMLYDAAKDGIEIDIRHNEQAVSKDDAFVAEQFIIQKGDPRFTDFKDYDGNAVDVTGGWGVVIKVESEELRKQYLDGEWNGVSMGGTAEMVAEKTDEEIQALAAKVAQELNKKSSNELEIDMTKEEMEALLAKQGETLAASVAKAVTDALKPSEKPTKKEDEEPEEDTLVFKGDPTDAKAVAEHLAKLNKARLQEEIDWSDPEAVAKHAETLKGQQKDLETNQKPVSKDEALDEEQKLMKESADWAAEWAKRNYGATA